MQAFQISSWHALNVKTWEGALVIKADYQAETLSQAMDQAAAHAVEWNKRERSYVGGEVNCITCEGHIRLIGPASMVPMTEQELQAIKVRGTSVYCITNPEWGTWGIMEDHGLWFDIHGRAGGRVLHKSEALQFWAIKK